MDSGLKRTAGSFQFADQTKDFLAGEDARRNMDHQPIVTLMIDRVLRYSSRPWDFHGRHHDW